MSNFDDSSSYSPSVENYNFTEKLRKKFTREDNILFDSIQHFYRRLGMMDVISNYLDLFRATFLKKGDRITKGIKNLFLNILRIINPPGKKQSQVVHFYLDKLISACNNLEIRKVLEHSINPPSSFLIKFINEKIYEETNLVFPHLTGDLPIVQRKFHFIQVPHQTATKARALLRKQIVSMVYEEICLLIIQNEYDGICTIHSPKAGDILLSNGETVEVKSNAIKIKSISTAKSKFGIYSGPQPLGHPQEGILFGITFLEKKLGSTREKPNFLKKFKEIHFNLRHLDNLNEDIKQAVVLSGISCPSDMSLIFLDLLFGDMVDKPGIPVLTNCISMPIIEPDFLNDLGSVKALGLKPTDIKKTKSKRSSKKSKKSKKK